MSNLKIVLAPNAMKECLSAPQIIEALKNGIRQVSPDIEVIEIPLADGGDGMLHAFQSMHPGEEQFCQAENPIGRTIQSPYYVIDNKTCIIEMANISGLALLKKEEQKAGLTSTYGLGQTILHAIESGYRDFIIGIGGSATNDVGSGMAQALGFNFNGLEENERANGYNLNKIDSIGESPLRETLKTCSFRIACDVNNPLLGSQGSSKVFGPQKGASEQDIERLERNVEHFSQIVNSFSHTQYEKTPGVGAAGGIGFMFKSLLHAELLPGAELILNASGFDQKIQGADLVMTTEGAIDQQTAQGKLPQIVAQRSKAQGLACVALCGALLPGWEVLREDGLNAFAIAPGPVSLEQSMQKASQYIQNITQDIVELFFKTR